MLTSSLSLIMRCDIVFIVSTNLLLLFSWCRRIAFWGSRKSCIQDKGGHQKSFLGQVISNPKFPRERMKLNWRFIFSIISKILLCISISSQFLVLFFLIQHFGIRLQIVYIDIKNSSFEFATQVDILHYMTNLKTQSKNFNIKTWIFWAMGCHAKGSEWHM